MPNYLDVVKKGKRRKLKPKRLGSGYVRFDYYFKDNMGKLKELNKDKKFKVMNKTVTKIKGTKELAVLYQKVLSNFVNSNIQYPIEDIIYYITYANINRDKLHVKKAIEKSGMHEYAWIEDFNYILIFRGINTTVMLPLNPVSGEIGGKWDKDLRMLKGLIYNHLEYAIITNIKFD